MFNYAPLRQKNSILPDSFNINSHKVFFIEMNILCFLLRALKAFQEGGKRQKYLSWHSWNLLNSFRLEKFCSTHKWAFFCLSRSNWISYNFRVIYHFNRKSFFARVSILHRVTNSRKKILSGNSKLCFNGCFAFLYWGMEKVRDLFSPSWLIKFYFHCE